MSTKKGVIGILTGGGDVPGLNPAIRAVTIRALREGYQVIGLRRGWLGAISPSERGCAPAPVGMSHSSMDFWLAVIHFIQASMPSFC